MLVNNYNSILKRKSGGLQPETRQHIGRILSDGGTVIDIPWMDSVIRTLKILGILSNCKLLTDANFGVKKDITGAVSKLYDISGNNNDAIQTTGASQPIWSLVNGKGVITYDGVGDFVTLPSSAAIGLDYTFIARFLPTAIQNTWGSILGLSTGLGLAMRKSNGTLTCFNNNTNSFGISMTIDTLVQIIAITSKTTKSLYKNGIYIAQNAIISINATPALGKGLGYFNGQINSSTIFNIALTQPQISTLYNLGL